MSKSKRILCGILSLLLLLSAHASVPLAAEEAPKAMTPASRSEDGERLLKYKSVPAEIEAPAPEEEKSSGLKNYIGPGYSFPSQYSSVEAGRVSSVMNQGAYGTCWAVTATTLAESTYYMNEKTGGEMDELSVMQLVGFQYGDKYDPLGNAAGDALMIYDPNSEGLNALDAGGNLLETAFSLSGWTNGALEETLPYTEEVAAKILNGTLEEEYNYDYDVAHLKNAYILPTARYTDEEIRNYTKRLITDYGAVGVSLCYDSSVDYYDPETCAYYCDDGTLAVNHAVTIVGWNDDYPASNFATEPSGNGAWLVQNSWGDGWGTDGDSDPGLEALEYDPGSQSNNLGYFWLSYDEKTLDYFVVAFEFEDADLYQHNYMYDGSACAATEDYAEGIRLGATYEVKGISSGREELDAVNIASFSADTCGTVTIIKNTDAEHPLEGEVVATQAFTTKYAGIYTVAIENAPVFSKGDYYTILLDYDDAVEYCYDANIPELGYVEDFTNDRTFYVDPGDEESPLHWTGAENYTLRIKGYTNDVYTVSFDANQGSGAPAAVDKVNGRELTLPETEPVRDGYEFLGWSESESAVTADYLPADVYDLDGDRTLYAVWKNNSDDYYVTVTETEKTVKAEETWEISYAANGRLLWSSDKPEVASVNGKGAVTAISAGVAVITASAVNDPSKSVTVQVTVEKADYQEVMDLIDAIPDEAELSGEYSSAVYAAASAYELLPRMQKLRVTNYEKLLQAEESQQDLLAVNEVYIKINAIGTVTYSANSQDLITAARRAFEALTAGQKDLFDEAIYKCLTDAEKTFAELAAASEAEKYTVVIDARLDGEPVSFWCVQGGGEYDSVLGGILSTDLTGMDYEFLGWYEITGSGEIGDLLSTASEFRYYPTEDVNISAVFRTGGAEYYYLVNVSAEKYSVVCEGAENSGSCSGSCYFMCPVFEDFTVTYEDEERTLLYWTDGYGNYLGNQKELTVNLCSHSPEQIIAVTALKGTESSYAWVVFEDMNGNRIGKKLYTVFDTIVLPEAPEIPGREFNSWSMTPEEIQKAMITSGQIEVRALYY